jgi:transcriptional regulator with PAS, ATPase and Fis domain
MKKRRKTIEGVSDQVLQILRKYDYPGNVRELENAIEHAFVMCNTDKIGIEHLPGKIVDEVNNGKNRIQFGENAEESEKAVISETLQRNKGHKARTAKELGFDRTTLWRKMKKHNIQFT